MPTLDISGTPVVFPFKPYACQLTYIRGVISALNGSVRRYIAADSFASHFEMLYYYFVVHFFTIYRKTNHSSVSCLSRRVYSAQAFKS